MSAAKRSRQQQSASSPPAAKRLKTNTQNSHVPASKGLSFLVDEDARNGRKLDAKLTNGVSSTKTNRVDESRAVVASNIADVAGLKKVGASQENAIGISSDEGSDSEGESDGEDLDDEEVNGKVAHVDAGKGMVNGHVREDEESGSSSSDAVAGAEDIDMDDRREGESEREEMSFGDMLRAQHPDAIDVQSGFPNPMANRQALLPAFGERGLSAPTGTSLGTVLTQALKTNDRDLLETCFQTTDVPSIRSTIQRLQSVHVATLLQRLAERIHRRPGRTGNLLVWVQWALVAHGGYLATQPDVVKQLKSLSLVIRERANGLQPLLRLKGKLDMLSSQLELRRSMAAANRAANGSDDEDEEGVVYVEGQNDDWSESDENEDMEEELQGDVKAIEPSKSKPKRQMATPRTDASSSDGDMPNGVVQQEDDDSSDAEEADEADLLDVEAEESSGDGEEADSEEASSESESEDGSDISDDESDASGEVIQPDPRTLNRKR